MPTAPRIPFAVRCVIGEAQLRFVEQQILRVDREPVADGRRLGGLQMRVAHADEVGVLFDRRREGA